MQTMTVPIFKGEGRLEYEERAIPQLEEATDVLVKIEACGICGTDLNILATPPAHKATPNIIIGHEGVGIVAEVGAGVSDLQPGDRVVIIGAGPMGLLFAQMYHTLGAGKIIMVDIAPYRLNFAQKIGIDETLNPTEIDLPQAVHDITGLGADIVVDTVGNQMGTAIKLARRGGRSSSLVSAPTITRRSTSTPSLVTI